MSLVRMQANAGDQTPAFISTANWRTQMISLALTFLIVALVAAVLGFSGIAGIASSIAWICFVVGIILALVFAVLGRRVV
jgi:uncharacterized membrane protein YtjA (UPF0391 family)